MTEVSEWSSLSRFERVEAINALKVRLSESRTCEAYWRRELRKNKADRAAQGAVMRIGVRVKSLRSAIAHLVGEAPAKKSAAKKRAAKR